MHVASKKIVNDIKMGQFSKKTANINNTVANENANTATTEAEHSRSQNP